MVNWSNPSQLYTRHDGKCMGEVKPGRSHHRNASVRATCAWVSCGRVACTNQPGRRGEFLMTAYRPRGAFVLLRLPTLTPTRISPRCTYEYDSRSPLCIPPWHSRVASCTAALLYVCMVCTCDILVNVKFSRNLRTFRA